jgi:hypothetical protein
MILWHMRGGSKAAELAWRCLTENKPVFAIRKQGVLLAGVYAKE